MYIRDKDKLHRIILLIYAVALLTVMMLCLIRIDTVCKMQVDTLNQIVEVRQEVDELGVNPVADKTPEPVSLGEFKITHYCPCEQCCGESDRVTYTGTIATAGRTISVDPDVIPLGSTVIIDGREYIAEDIGGGIRGNEIDMFVEDHQEALDLGVYTVEVLMEVGSWTTAVR